MYTPKDLKSDSRQVFFKLLSFVIYSNIIYIVFVFISIMLYAYITGEYSSVENALNSIDSRFFTLINESGITLVGIGLFVKNKAFFIEEFKKTNRRISSLNFMIYLFILFCLGILGTGLLHLSSLKFDNYFDTINSKSPVSIIFIILIIPIVEELLFRGTVQKPLEKYGKFFAIIISSLVFAIYHGNLIQGIYAFICGLLLGFTASEYSLKYSVFLHIFHNISSVIVENKPFTAIYKNQHRTLSIVIVSLFFILWYLWEKYPVIKNYIKLNRPIFTGAYRICLISLPVILFAIINLLPVII